MTGNDWLIALNTGFIMVGLVAIVMGIIFILNKKSLGKRKNEFYLECYYQRNCFRDSYSDRLDFGLFCFKGIASLSLAYKTCSLHFSLRSRCFLQRSRDVPISYNKSNNLKQ